MTQQDINRFDAPIPGQSLTQEPGKFNHDSPPQYVDVNIAAEAIWSTMKKPKMALQIKELLEAGEPAETIANTITFGGFTEGKWLPEVGLMLEKPVMSMIRSIGKRQGVKDIRMLKPDTEYADSMHKIRKVKEDRGITGDVITSGPEIVEEAAPIESMRLPGDVVTRGPSFVDADLPDESKQITGDVVTKGFVDITDEKEQGR